MGHNYSVTLGFPQHDARAWHRSSGFKVPIHVEIKVSTPGITILWFRNGVSRVGFFFKIMLREPSPRNSI